MKTNEELQKDVQNAIKWEPSLRAAEIGVIAKDGIVSLTGVVDSYAKKMGAENAAKKVAGVKALVEKIEVKFPSSFSKTNAEIAEEVLNALKSNWSLPKDKITIKVEDGWVTLEGELPWNFQKEVARKAISDLAGVKGIINNIKIRSESINAIEKKELEEALARNWALSNQDIKVTVAGTKVTLSGKVSSWFQRNEAEKIAWNTPGVWSISNELEVEYDFSYSNQ